MQTERQPLASVVKAAPLFAALGDETRLAVLLRLARAGPSSITALGAEVEVSRQAVTKHVDVLIEAGLVRATRQGRERICALDPKRLTEAQTYLEQISTHWDDALSRLKDFVEK